MSCWSCQGLANAAETSSKQVCQDYGNSQGDHRKERTYGMARYGKGYAKMVFFDVNPQEQVDGETLVQSEGFGACPQWKDEKDISSILTKEKYEANVKRAAKKKSLTAPTKNVKDSTKAPTKNVKDSKKTSDEDEEQSDEDEVPSDEDDSDSSEEKGNSSKRHRSGYSRSYTRAVKEAEDKEKASLKRRRIDSSSSDDDLPLMHLKKSKPLRK